MKKSLAPAGLVHLFYCVLFLLWAVDVEAQQLPDILIAVKNAETKEPVAGASIYWKGSTVSGITDSNGVFRTTRGPGDTILRASCIGFAGAVQRVPVEYDDGPVVIWLRPLAESLQGVTVSTGYQRLPRERATGSFEYVGKAELDLQLGSNVLQRLEGIASGVQFEQHPQRPNVTIRGVSTINGPKDPLIVVDNFPFEGDINSLNPNDIASVTVLKDAAAASIWGSRAGNGVIVITTREGSRQEALRVELNANVVTASPPDLFSIPVMKTADYIGVEQLLFQRGYYRENAANPVAFSPVVELLFLQRNGRVDSATVASRLADWAAVDVRNEYRRWFYQRTMNQQYALNLQGRSGVLQWFMSGGYDQNHGSLGQLYRRASLRSTNTLQLRPGIRLRVGFQYSSMLNESGRPGYGSVTMANGVLYPYAQFADENGLPGLIYKDYRQPYKDSTGMGLLQSWNYYPLTDWQHDRRRSDNRHLLGTLDLQLRLLKGLHVSILYQYENQQSLQEDWRGEESYFTRNLINTFSQINRANGTIRYAVPLGGISDNAFGHLRAHQWRVQANYLRRFGVHELSVVAGAERRQRKEESETYRLYGVDANTLSHVKVDLVDPFPHYVTRGKAFVPSVNGLGGTDNRFVSMYVNGGYTILGKYTITASARKDASNLFGVESNKRGVPLWSAGAAWNILKEGFARRWKLDDWRLRVSYGYMGNADPSRSAVTTIRYVGSALYTNASSAQIFQYSNPTLRWERVGTFNIGTDISTRARRLVVTADYYIKKGVDLFGTVPVDQTTGVGQSVVRNVASMRGHGVDVTINSLNTRGAVLWSTQWLFSYNRTKVLSYYLNNVLGRNFVSAGNVIAGMPGQPVYSIAGFNWVGLDSTNGNPIGVLDGKLTTDYNAIMSRTTADEIVYAGSALPVWFGSLMNSVKWKGLTISVNLSYETGHYFRKSSVSYSALFSGVGHSEYARRWQQPGDELYTSVPSLIYPANANRDRFYNQASIHHLPAGNLRLQFVHLQYNVPMRKKAMKYIKGVECYANGSQLGLLWKANKEGLDPEYPDGLAPRPQWGGGVRLHW